MHCSPSTTCHSAAMTACTPSMMTTNMMMNNIILMNLLHSSARYSDEDEKEYAVLNVTLKRTEHRVIPGDGFLAKLFSGDESGRKKR